MIELGVVNNLKILRDTPPGLFLGDEDGNEVLLPNRYVPEVREIDSYLDVFVYLDNEERIVSVTDLPYIQKGSFALLRCNEVTSFGAFLDWGLVKELFCPFKEMAFKMKKGDWYLVHCYLDDETNRLLASSKTNRFLDNKTLSVEQLEEVDIIISHPSELGMNVIVNNIHSGLIFSDNIFKDISVGDKLRGVIKKVHENNKLDISLGYIGYRNIEPNSNFILDKITDSDGFLAVTDKSSPELIKDTFQMSKKSFKKALGSLYKQQLITIKNDGIYLNDK
jgi:predicted RNA-binding protein (virulence factor B family)|tara:strand:+ start:412 stop:1248 length:837 start_codon:yes stop_codon:yes gene_type:complete